MTLEQRVARFVELWVCDDRDTLGQRARNLDTILVELLLSHQVGQVLNLCGQTRSDEMRIEQYAKTTYHEDDRLSVTRVNERIEHLAEDFFNVVLLNE